MHPGETASEILAIKISSRKNAENIGETTTVLPVVFTSCDPVEADYSDAANDDILLLGRDQLNWLFGLIRDNIRASQIMKELEQAVANQKLQYPMVARWESRY